MTSANRRAISTSWPAEALKTAVSQDIVFLSLPLHIFPLNLSAHSLFGTHPSRYHLIPQHISFSAIPDIQIRGATILIYKYISTGRKKIIVRCANHNSLANHLYVHLIKSSQPEMSMPCQISVFRVFTISPPLNIIMIIRSQPVMTTPLRISVLLGYISCFKFVVQYKLCQISVFRVSTISPPLNINMIIRPQPVMTTPLRMSVLLGYISYFNFVVQYKLCPGKPIDLCINYISVDSDTIIARQVPKFLHSETATCTIYFSCFDKYRARTATSSLYLY